MLGLTLRKNNRGVDLYDPFRMIDEFERSFFGHPFGSFFDTPVLNEFRTDVTDKGDHYLLECDLPGFEKKDIHLEVSDGVLTISAERRSSLEEGEKDKALRIERSYGSYSRRFGINGIEVDKIKAKYENGVLRLTLPKEQELLPEKKELTIE